MTDRPPTTTSPAGEVRPIGASPGVRVLSGLVGISCFALLGLAAYLKPSSTGVETHLQLGLKPCGWLVTLGKPCPTCGMTTAFAHAARGHFTLAMIAQPMGAVLALATAAGFWTGLHVAVTGSRVGILCGTLLRPRVMWIVVAAAVLSWTYKLYTHASAMQGG